MSKKLNKNNETTFRQVTPEEFDALKAKAFAESREFKTEGRLNKPFMIVSEKIVEADK